MTEAFEGSFADVAADEPYPGVSRRTVDAAAATVNRYDFEPGATFPRHRHTQEQITLVLEGSVGRHGLARWRLLRYEVRVWPDGVLPDEKEAVGGPQVLSEDPEVIDRLLEATRHIPMLVWGRDQIGAGDMWNSNSVISWLLARAGLDMDGIEPPDGGRAPGWAAGLAAAGRPSVLTVPD